MKERLIKVIRILFIAALLSGGYAFLCFHGIMIPCMFRQITGLRCPGCGVTHMVLDILKFDIPGAFTENQALFFILPTLAVLILFMTIRYIKEGKMYSTRFETAMYIAMIAVLVPFGIFRNVYGF